MTDKTHEGLCTNHTSSKQRILGDSSAPVQFFISIGLNYQRRCVKCKRCRTTSPNNVKCSLQSLCPQALMLMHTQAPPQHSHSANALILAVSLSPLERPRQQPFLSWRHWCAMLHMGRTGKHCSVSKLQRVTFRDSSAAVDSPSFLSISASLGTTRRPYNITPDSSLQIQKLNGTSAQTTLKLHSQHSHSVHSDPSAFSSSPPPP